MHFTDIVAARLAAQQIDAAKFKKVKQLVTHMGALQAQDYAMAKWAIGLRLPGVTDTHIEKALDKREIFRTHVLRPTWHIITAADIYWMLAFTANRIKAASKTVTKQLAITKPV